MPALGWRADLTERFEAKYTPEPNSGCWLWTGANDGRRGYGKMQAGRTTVPATHVSVSLFQGKTVPPRMEVDHKCRNPHCVNPDHLEIVTHEENMRRAPKMGLALGGKANGARQRAKTHCPQGHPYEDAYVSTQGWRRCRPCVLAKEARRRARHAREATGG